MYRFFSALFPPAPLLLLSIHVCNLHSICRAVPNSYRGAWQPLAFRLLLRFICLHSRCKSAIMARRKRHFGRRERRPLFPGVFMESCAGWCDEVGHGSGEEVKVDWRRRSSTNRLTMTQPTLTIFGKTAFSVSKYLQVMSSMWNLPSCLFIFSWLDQAWEKRERERSAASWWVVTVQLFFSWGLSTGIEIFGALLARLTIQTGALLKKTVCLLKLQLPLLCFMFSHFPSSFCRLVVVGGGVTPHRRSARVSWTLSRDASVPPTPPWLYFRKCPDTLAAEMAVANGSPMRAGLPKLSRRMNARRPHSRNEQIVQTLAANIGVSTFLVVLPPSFRSPCVNESKQNKQRDLRAWLI